MRKLLFSIGTLLYTVTCMGTSKKELPNILFLLVDDMQRTCIHHNGCEQVSTPNIDRIYQNGISFHSTYTNGSLGGALSMPSRAMIMTGRGVFQIVKDGQVIPEQHVTLPELLRQHGYITLKPENGTRISHPSTALFLTGKIYSSEECTLMKQTAM